MKTFKILAFLAIVTFFSFQLAKQMLLIRQAQEAKG